MFPSTRSKCCLHIVADLNAVDWVKSFKERFAKENNFIRSIRPRKTAETYGDRFRTDVRRVHCGVGRTRDRFHSSRQANRLVIRSSFFSKAENATLLVRDHRKRLGPATVDA
jgi:hypothetical protein